MPIAPELEQVSPATWLWRHYDAGIKAEVFSTAINTSNGLVLIDPISLSPPGLRDLGRLGDMSGIVLTNGNHIRSALDFADRFSIPIYACPASFPDEKPTQFRPVVEGDIISTDIKLFALQGAGPGELAIHCPQDGGTLVVGDALINFEPYGFTFLPAKYCIDAIEMKRSLRKLLGVAAERILFAHGLPLVSKPTERLHDLLNTG